MATERKCPDCGAAIPAASPPGWCPHCELTGALEAAPPPATGSDGAQTELAPPYSGPKLRYFGDYELLDEIAWGGMGVVYQARQVSLNRTVAVKMILSGRLASAKEVERFRAEARAAASLQHPNILPIHEVGEHEGQHYFSMEFVDGRNLAQVVRGNPLPVARGARYVQIIAQAIQFAHDRGVLHRDLKPSNVLIDPFDQPRITDFGLAKKTTGDSELTETGQVLGAPSFMPPEQAAGRKDEVGIHSDVYALGAILYYLLTGRPPFAGETITATLAQVQNIEPAPPRLLNASVPRDLETICLKCLEKNPPRRYRSARELADELSRFLRGEPILARPVTPVEKAWRWSCRNPLLTGLGLALVLVFVSGFAGVTWEWQRAERHAKEEARQRLRADAKAQAEASAKADADEQRQRAERLAKGEARERQLAEERAQAEARAVQRAEKLAEEEGVQRRRAETSAAEEVRQRQRAETLAAEETRQRRRANEALNRMEMQGAETLFASDDSASALASLAHVLRRDSSNRVAAERLLSALAQRTFALPVDTALTLPFDARRGSDWNVNSGVRVKELPGSLVANSKRLSGRLRIVEFSSSGHWCATVWSNVAQVWSADSGRPVTKPLNHNKGRSLDSAQFSPDGELLATIASTSAWVWDIHNSQLLKGSLISQDAVTLARFSPDGQRLV